MCVAVDARKERGEYKDTDGDFVRATNCVTVTASGSICVVTAGAKALGPYSGPGVEMEKWLRTKLQLWEALPAAERQPGAVTIPAAASIDPKRAALALPPRTLVVRVFNRHLGWNADRSLRYALTEDYLPGTSKSTAQRYAMAQNDFLWIPEKEWQALVPDAPRVGERIALPSSFVLRLLRYHLDPARGFTESTNFAAANTAAGTFELIVTAVTTQRVVLELAGAARLRQAGREEPATYEPALLGYLEYEPKTKSCTRFDIVALGAASGLPCDANGKIAFRKGTYPVGIAFELVASPTTAEKLHPRGARDNPAAYFEPREKR